MTGSRISFGSCSDSTIRLGAPGRRGEMRETHREGGLRLTTRRRGADAGARGLAHEARSRGGNANGARGAKDRGVHRLGSVIRPSQSFLLVACVSR